ncbi:MAG: alpha/beta hydrolase [Bdellovibrionota bacterium]
MHASLGLETKVFVQNCRYASWERGQGHTLVLLHGWPLTSLHWRKVAPQFVSRGFKTVCIDLRGLGDSLAENGNFEKENLAKEIEVVLDSVLKHEEKFSVVGHDWGGSVAAALAKISKRVSSVVIEEEIPPGIGVSIPKPGADHYPIWHVGLHGQKPLAEILISKNQNEYFDFFLSLRANAKSLDPEDRKEFLNAYRSPKRLPTFLEYYRTREKDAAFFQKISRKKLKVPVLALGGKFAMGSAVGEAAKKLFTRSECHVFKSSAHYPAQEEPKLFVEKVWSFCKKHGETRP